MNCHLARAVATCALPWLVVLTGPSIGSPQQFAARVDAARVQVVPVDRTGQFVGGLPADAFGIVVNGERREVLDVLEVGPHSAIKEDHPGGRFVVLFDLNTGSPRQTEMRYAYEETHRLIDDLRAGDRMAILFAPAAYAIVEQTDFTGDREQLYEAVRTVSAVFLRYRPPSKWHGRCCAIALLQNLLKTWPSITEANEITQLVFFSKGDADYNLELPGPYRQTVTETAQAFRELGIVAHMFQPFAVPSGVDRPRMEEYLRPRVRESTTAAEYFAIESSGTAWYFREALSEGIDAVARRTRTYYLVSFPLKPDDGTDIEVDVEVRSEEVASWAFRRSLDLSDVR